MGSFKVTVKYAAYQISLSFQSGFGSGDEIITKWTLWDDPSNGLAATIKVPVTEEINRWGVNFHFNKLFSNIDFLNGLSEINSGHSFNVTNEAWSGIKHPGDLISFGMLGDYEQGNDD